MLVQPAFAWTRQGKYTLVDMRSMEGAQMPKLVTNLGHSLALDGGTAPGMITDIWGAARSFADATNNRLTLGYASLEFPIAGYHASFSLFRFTSSADERSPIAKYDLSNERQYLLCTTAASPAALRGQIGSQVAFDTSAVMTVGAVYMGALICRNDGFAYTRLYDAFGNLLDTASAATVANSGFTGDTTIGGRADGGDEFAGNIGCVYVWDEFAPTDAQLDQLARDPFGPVNPPGKPLIYDVRGTRRWVER